MLTVHLRINDAVTKKPTPARVQILGPDGTYYAPLGRLTEFPTGPYEDVGGQVRISSGSWAIMDGSCEVRLPAEVPLQVSVRKGPGTRVLTETVTLGPGQISLRFELTPVPPGPLAGWLSADCRSHAMTPHAALLEAAAEGLDVVNLLAAERPVLMSDANTYGTTPNLLAFSGQTAALADPYSAIYVNTHNRHPALGRLSLLHAHRVIYPIQFGEPVSADDHSLFDWCDQCHRKKGLVVWTDAFRPGGGLPGGEALVAAILGKIDAIEFDPEPRSVPFLPWIYRLWNAGIPLTIVGSSAKQSNKHVLGAMRTRTPPQEGGTRNFSVWAEDVRRGATVVTTGPEVRLDVVPTENG
ncbi:MAG: hypothetical protein ACRCZF_17505, partial [Gemmataceae bacterium]